MRAAHYFPSYTFIIILGVITLNIKVTSPQYHKCSINTIGKAISLQTLQQKITTSSLSLWPHKTQHIVIYTYITWVVAKGARGGGKVLGVNACAARRNWSVCLWLNVVSCQAITPLCKAEHIGIYEGKNAPMVKLKNVWRYIHTWILCWGQGDVIIQIKMVGFGSDTDWTASISWYSGSSQCVIHSSDIIHT